MPEPAPAPVLFWLRRDLRLSDHPGLTAAAVSGAPVIPVFVLDPETEAIGAAARWRLGLGLADFRRGLPASAATWCSVAGRRPRRCGAGARDRRRGGALDPALPPDAVTRDKAVKAGLAADGVRAESHPGHLLHEPWAIATRAGGAFKVYTPFWRALAARDAPPPLPAVKRLPAPARWPARIGSRSGTWAPACSAAAAVVASHARVGAAAAEARLRAFLDGPVGRLRSRPRPPRPGRDHAALGEFGLGEISPRSIWHATRRAEEHGAEGARDLPKELAWREFAWHLAWHTPRLLSDNWREDWDGFPWRRDNPDAERWRRGLTGEPMVDAGMREMYVTGPCTIACGC